MDPAPRALAWAQATPKIGFGPLLAVMFGVTLPSVVAAVMVLAGNQGHFAYGMDGPYIHMAMADQIRQGSRCRRWRRPSVVLAGADQ